MWGIIAGTSALVFSAVVVKCNERKQKTDMRVAENIAFTNRLNNTQSRIKNGEILTKEEMKEPWKEMCDHCTWKDHEHRNDQFDKTVILWANSLKKTG